MIPIIRKGLTKSYFLLTYTKRRVSYIRVFVKRRQAPRLSAKLFGGGRGGHVLGKVGFLKPPLRIFHYGPAYSLGSDNWRH